MWLETNSLLRGAYPRRQDLIAAFDESFGGRARSLQPQGAPHHSPFGADFRRQWFFLPNSLSVGAETAGARLSEVGVDAHTVYCD